MKNILRRVAKLQELGDYKGILALVVCFIVAPFGILIFLGIFIYFHYMAYKLQVPFDHLLYLLPLETYGSMISFMLYGVVVSWGVSHKDQIDLEKEKK